MCDLVQINALGILIFCIKSSDTELNFAQELKILTLCSKQMLAQSTVVKKRTRQLDY